MEIEGCYITSKEMKTIEEMSEEILGNMALIRMFCAERKNVDDFYIVIPIIKRTEKISDILYAKFIDISQQSNDMR